MPYHATNCECFVSRALLVDLEPGTTDSKWSGPWSIILAVDRDTPVTKAIEQLNIECGAALRSLRIKGMEIFVKINSPQVVPYQFQNKLQFCGDLGGSSPISEVTSHDNNGDVVLKENNHKNGVNYVSCILQYRGDIYNSDLMWRRLIRSVLEQSLAILRSSQGLIVL